MNDVEVLAIVTDMLGVAARVSGPILGAALVIGVVVSLLQTVTQIQEMTLTFVPKLVGVALILVFGGNWMLREILGFITRLWATIPTIAG